MSHSFLPHHPGPLIMAILNVTPDSFSDGGRFFDADAALRQAEQLIEDGAHVLDIGGESSRPGADAVSADEERRRVVPIIQAIRQRFDIPISIDTVKASVARDALDAGANWINDISALQDDDQMAALAAESGAPVILMHRQGTPEKKYLDFEYDDLIADLSAFFEERINAAVEAGIAREKLMLDPGVGFGKSAVQNCLLLKDLGKFKSFGLPILVGTSRKSFIGKLIGVPMEARLPSTIVSNMIAVQHGADIVRVHDVAEMKQALTMMRYILDADEVSAHQP